MHTGPVDLRHLRSFAAVARTSSFTAAADELGYTQSAVSQHVAALEAELGQPLLTRRPVGLTAAGAQLAAHARHILLRVDVARRELARRSGPARPLAVAVTPLALGPRLLAVLRAVPAVDRLEVEAAGDALRLLAGGRVDVAVVDGVTAPNGPLPLTEPGVLARHPVAEVGLEVLLPAGHPLAGCAGLDLATLRDAHWIDAPHLRCDPSVVPGAERPASRRGLRYQGRDLAVLVRLVAEERGMALLPAGLALAHPGVHRVPLTRPRVVHRTELLVVPGRQDDVRGIVDAVRGGS
jgi:DNA-binding transcriptional LysR family regulator